MPKRRGRLTLVGSGPGGADLLTVKGARALAEADLVLVDRLSNIPREELHELAPHAHVVEVGKQPGRHMVTQDRINDLIVENALVGRQVVRLKGGDPYVFGRGAEERVAAESAGVEVVVVPGITSAVAVPASVGIPVTHRSLTRAFTVVSAHDPISHEEAHALVTLGGTIVVLMGMGTLHQTVATLLAQGLAPSTPAAIVQDGLTEAERSVRSRVDALPRVKEEHDLANPAVIVIGDVADATLVAASGVTTSTFPRAHQETA